VQKARKKSPNDIMMRRELHCKKYLPDIQEIWEERNAKSKGQNGSFIPVYKEYMALL